MATASGSWSSTIISPTASRMMARSTLGILEVFHDRGFKLDELNKYLSLYRFYNKDDYILYEKLLDFLSLKKQSLLEERDRIGTFIMLLNKCIKDVENERDSASRRLMDKEKEASSGMLPAERFFNQLLLLLCKHGFFFIEDSLFIAIFLHCVINFRVTQI